MIGTVPSVDVFDDVCTAKGVPNAPRARTDPKRAILDPSSNTKRFAPQFVVGENGLLAFIAVYLPLFHL